MHARATCVREVGREGLNKRGGMAGGRERLWLNVLYHFHPLSFRLSESGYFR